MTIISLINLFFTKMLAENYIIHDQPAVHFFTFKKKELRLFFCYLLLNDQPSAFNEMIGQRINYVHDNPVTASEKFTSTEALISKLSDSLQQAAF